MESTSEESRRNRFLLTNLVILTIFVITLVFLVANYTSILAPDPTRTPTISPTYTAETPQPPTRTPTQTPEPTHTLLPTFTPTTTSTPSLTVPATLTPRPAGPATLAPAPVPGGVEFNLHAWTPEKAQELVNYLTYYPDTLVQPTSNADQLAYYESFQFPIFAAREALLQFPDSPQAEQWRWGLAYNLVQMGEADAGEAYAQIIEQALNSGKVTDTQTLRDWFSSSEQRLQLYQTKIQPPAGFVSAQIIEIRSQLNFSTDNQNQGSAYLLLLETPEAYQVVPIFSGFNFIGNPDYRFLLSDITGDQFEELFLYLSNPSGTYLNLPKIFDLSQVPIKPLPFRPSQSDFNLEATYENYWAPVANDNGYHDLEFKTQLFPACPMFVSLRYSYNAEIGLELSQDNYAVEPDPDTLAFCRFAIDHSAQVWGPEASIQILQTLLPLWPPDLDEQGEPSPIDAQDELRFRLGVAHSLAGDPEQAREILTDLVKRPTLPASRWVEPAQKFLETYQAPEDIYRACIQTPLCNAQDAIHALVKPLSPESAARAIELLWQAGVTPRASGYFDFDQDGENEFWFTVRHRPAEKLEFWILSPYATGLKTIPVTYAESNRPTLEILADDFVVRTADQTGEVVFLDKKHAFVFQRDPDTFEPYISFVTLREEYPNRFFNRLSELEKQLFDGAKPATIARDLERMKEDPGLLCKPYWNCDRYYYLLGLANELADNHKVAIDTYLQLWRDYSKSPFTVMARFKLQAASQAPTPTSTPSPTPSAPAVSPNAGTIAPSPTGPTPTKPAATLTPSPTQPVADHSPTPSPTPGTAYPFEPTLTPGDPMYP